MERFKTTSSNTGISLFKVCVLYGRISITYSSAMGAYEYIVRRYFRQYKSAYWGFIDYAELITNNTRYKKALDYYFYPENYLTENAKSRICDRYQISVKSA
ncbi:MAG: hypothetical protein QM751_12910 [Paludibacteraceae bacterium]